MPEKCKVCGAEMPSGLTDQDVCNNCRSEIEDKRAAEDQLVALLVVMSTLG